MAWIESGAPTTARVLAPGDARVAVAPGDARLPLAAGGARPLPLEPEPDTVPAPWIVERIETAEELEGVRDEWNDLLRTSWSDCLFLTWEWLHTWWKHCGAGRRLAVHLVRYGRDLRGIGPFMVGRTRSIPGIGAESVQFLGSGYVGSDYLDVIVRPALRAQTLAALGESLHATRRLVDLAQLRAGSSTAHDLARRLERRGFGVLRRTIAVCPFIPLDGHTFESYLETLGSSHRYNFRRRLRQLQRTFDVRFERVETEEQRRAALDVLVRLHIQRFDGRGGSDALNTPDLVAFHDEFSALALRRGWLRLFVLRLDGRPAAALYGFRYGTRFAFYQAGFDEAFARYSVGLVTMGLSIEAAIEEGAREYDLLHGDEPYKFLWARSTRELERIELFPPGAAGLAHRLLRRGSREARARLRRLAAAGRSATQTVRARVPSRSTSQETERDVIE
jgi:CelD/BcsL family acetyltransferase involved in cellulose biosynthesis